MMNLGLSLGIGSQRGGGVAAFDPSLLFASSEQGAWYDPSDLTSMRQLSTGGTAAAVGSPVGFIADKRLMGGQTFDAFVAGQPELVTNGGFDTDSDWTKNNWTISGGQASTTDGSEISQPITTTTGSWYLVSVNLVSDGPIFIRFAGAAQQYVGAVGETQFRLQSGGSPNLAIFANAGTSAIIDNISVKAIPGNHATQATAAARPILRQTIGGVYYIEDDLVDDTLNWAAPADTYDIAYADRDGNVTVSAAQSLSGTTDILKAQYLKGYLAIDRTLTAGEIASLEGYWG